MFRVFKDQNAIPAVFEFAFLIYKEKNIAIYINIYILSFLRKRQDSFVEYCVPRLLSQKVI